MHQCPDAQRRRRTHLPTPFKRPRATYTLRFEQYVLESPVGWSMEDAARRLPAGASPLEIGRYAKPQTTQEVCLTSFDSSSVCKRDDALKRVLFEPSIRVPSH